MTVDVCRHLLAIAGVLAYVLGRPFVLRSSELNLSVQWLKKLAGFRQQFGSLVAL